MKIILLGKERDTQKPFFHKILIIMNLTVLFLTIACLQVSAVGFAQKITLSVKNVPLSTTFSEIEKQSDYKFFYDNKLIKNIRNVSIDFHDASVTEVLDELMRNQALMYSIVDHTIVIQGKNVKEVKTADLAVPRSAIRMEENRGQLLAETSLHLAPIVEGRVVDERGEALPGVSILVKGTQRSTSTNTEGAFSIDVLSQNATLVFSFIGYETQEISVAGKSSLNVTMIEGTSRLDEVVVVGYGTQKRATLTGSVASVSGEVLQNSPALNIGNAIAGLLPGVISKNTSGEPGRDDPTILVRGRNTTGNNNPLVVVDGIQDVAGWQRINPNDIESISVLKDASAAIYGARAANGVILITTKRGKLGKPTISYSFNQGIASPTRLPKMAGSADYAGFVNQLDVEAGQSPRYSDAEIELFRNGTDPNYINEDWYSAVLRKHSSQSQHNLNVRGGGESVKYSVSGSYSDEGSIFKNGSLDFKTYAIRSNVDADINKNLKVGFDLNGALEDGNYPAYSTSQTFDFLKQIPFLPVYWPNGLPSAGIENGINPGLTGTSVTGNSNNKTYRYIAKASFDLNIPQVEGLGIDGYFSFTNNNSVGKDWQTPWTVYDYDKITDTYIPKKGGGLLAPQLTQTFGGSTGTLVNLRLKYDREFGDHKLNTFIAAEVSNSVLNNFSAFRKNYISSAIDELFAGSLVDQQTNGTRTEGGRKNLFGRVSYGYKDKYLVDFNARYDGSSNFPKGRQFGFFPGVSAAWRISEEDFMKNSSGFINELKLRGSIGRIGNDAIAAFQDLRLYSIGNTGMSFGSSPIALNGLIAGVTPNPYITWEVATMMNLGVDASFANGLVGLNVDLFKQRRSNILAKRDLSVPAYTGLSLPNENIGVVENKGLEVELNHSKRIGDFSYRIAGNVSYSRNKVVDISEAQNVAEWKKAEGHVLGASQYYHAIGIFRTQEEVNSSPVYPGTKVGDLKYEDKDGDGKITANDMYTMDKTNTPEIFYGLNLSTSYKNFSLFANFAGARNVWQYYHLEARVAVNTLEDAILNRYTPGSMDSKLPNLPTIGLQTEPSGLKSDFWLKNSNYVRLKTLELSYDIPKDLLSRIKVQSMRLFVNGQNLFTIDDVKWADPENTSQSSSYYPQSKIYNFGLNLTF